MLKLTPKSTEPVWIDLLPGVRLQLRPATIAMILLAREAAVDVYRADRVAEEADKDPHVGVTAGVAMNKRYARDRIIAWEGIGDAAGEPAPVTPENIDWAMDVIAFNDAFDRLVLGPAISGEAAEAA